MALPTLGLVAVGRGGVDVPAANAVLTSTSVSAASIMKTPTPSCRNLRPVVEGDGRRLRDRGHGQSYWSTCGLSRSPSRRWRTQGSAPERDAAASPVRVAREFATDRAGRSGPEAGRDDRRGGSPRMP